MDRNDYFFPIAVMDGETPIALAGTAFLVAPGTMMTCRHVVDKTVDLAVHDLQTDEFLPLPGPTLDPRQHPLDLAIFESPLKRDTPPIAFTRSETVRMGSMRGRPAISRDRRSCTKSNPRFSAVA